MVRLPERLAAWLRRPKDERITSGMSARDLWDIAMTPAGMNAMVGFPADVRDRMEAMAGVFGVGANRIDAERWRAFDMIQACGHCPHHAPARRHWRRGT